MGSMVRYDWKGQPLTLTEICRIEGIARSTVDRRMRMMGMSLEEAVTREPMRSDAVHITEGTERKPFKKLTRYEVDMLCLKKCKKCKYHGSKHTIYCDYYERSGWQRRGVDPRDCEKWKEPGRINARKGLKRHDTVEP